MIKKLILRQIIGHYDFYYPYITVGFIYCSLRRRHDLPSIIFSFITLIMKYLYLIIFPLFIIACTNSDQNASANIIKSLHKASNSDLAEADSLYLPPIGNGIKHIVPQKDFLDNYALYQELLQEFIPTELPYELDQFIVDKTNDDWKELPVLHQKFYPYLMDANDYQTVQSVLNPRESFEDFYKVYPIAKFKEREYFNTIIYAIRYFDGNGQQDFFYVTTFNNAGALLSTVEIGAFEASSESYIKTGSIVSENLIKTQRANYDGQLNDWINTSESQYYLDNTGQVYYQFENQPYGSSKSGKSEGLNSFMKMSDFQNYFSLFQKGVNKNEPEKLLNFITFPHFRISYEEHYQHIKSKEEFLSQYDIVFNESLRKKIINQNYNELITKGDEVGLSDGSMWFKKIGRDNDGHLVVAISVN